MNEKALYFKARRRFERRLARARLELWRAEVLARVLREEVLPPAELADMQRRLDPGRLLFAGVRLRPACDQAELRRTLWSDLAADLRRVKA